jgi:tetratricopeptide (TPR) repeat protein
MILNLLRNSVLVVLIAWLLANAADLRERVPQVPADAKAPMDSVFDRALTQIINATFRDQYEKANRIADSLLEKHPEHPAPYFFKAAVLQEVMSTYRVNKFQKEVETNVQRAIDTGNLLLTSSNDPWLHFYLGGAYGYRGFNRFRKLNFIGAYRDAQRGIDQFDQALQKDSTLYDVYLGLGSYYYYRTARSKFLRIITFWIPDKRDLGLAQLKFSFEHGRYAIYDAIYVLMAAYYDNGNYDQAMEVTQQAIQMKEAPNLTDLYFKGRLLANDQQWPEAKSIFEQIYEKIKDHQYQSIGYQVECKYWIARALSEGGQDWEALKLAREALSLSRQRDSNAEIEGHLDSFDDIKENLEELNKELNIKLSGK